MFSHSRQPENAACAARVSEDLPLAPGSNPSSASAHSAAPNTHAPSSLSPAEIGSYSPFDHPSTAAVVLPSASDASAPSSTTPPSAPTATAHGDQDNSNKRPRPPLPLSRSTGPSLLTQALASARGIPSSTNSLIPPLDQRRPDPHDQQRPDALKNVSNHLQELTLAEPRLDSLGRSTSNSPIPAGSQTQGDALTAGTISPVSPSSTHSETEPGAAFPIAMPGRTETTSPQVRGSRPGYHTITRTRGRSLGRTEKEARIHSLSGIELPSADNIGDTSFRRGESPFPPNKPVQDWTDDRVQYQAWRSKDIVSVGPEKAWSIGVDNAIDDHDGQVEKSITEALAGMEPTRSRKASHSLRFFKEGLPSDKTKRKDSKPSPIRERPSEPYNTTHVKTSPSPFNQDANMTFQNGNPPSNIVIKDQPTARSSMDYFGLQMGKSSNFENGRFQEEPEALISISTPQQGHLTRHNQEVIGSASQLREDTNGTEITKVVEESEESSEEKISSAVFLPHQGLEGSEEHGTRFNEKVKPVSRLPSTNDFHSWLVKADEPEPEAEGNDSCSSTQMGISTDKAHHDSYGRELPHKISHECSARHETELLAAHHGVAAKTAGPASQLYDDIVHEHQLAPKEPLEAIELIPYKHQVGGHTTLWRFSKRAVCKQLNNRENEFYENIERCHRDLLPFLPRYIGVLNVTYQKQPRRKSTVRKDEGLGAEKLIGDAAAQSNGQIRTGLSGRSLSGGHEGESHRRVVSQSLQSGHIPIPTVTFVDNQHILPRSLLQPSGYSSQKERPRSASAVATRQNDLSTLSSNNPLSKLARPSLEDRHANSWGATTVNKKLRNEVFNDAFLKRPIAVHKHQTPASHHRLVPRHPMQSRSAESVPIFSTSEDLHDSTSLPNLSRPPKYPASLLFTHSDIGSKSLGAEVNGADHIKDVTGTSAPEPDTLGEKFAKQVRKRRYSGSKLRRRPEDVSDARGDLKYFEDADDVGYRGDGESETFSPLVESRTEELGSASTGVGHRGEDAVRLPEPELPPLPHISTRSEVQVSRPVNPKEAQTQRDSRVEYFLLLEDLTAGMKRPCVMDLKMGTRQYGVVAGAKKRESQRRKCAETTSRELGVRVCGLQTWDAKSQTYIFRDKYYGRDLKAGKEFRDTLTMFLYNGLDYESVLRHIPVILQKLNQLEKTVLRLRGYRFYAASLLIFYDAGTPGSGNDTTADDSTTDFATDTEDAWDIKRRRRDKAEIDIKIADFANSVIAGDPMSNKPCPPQHQDEPDRGFLRGLATLRKCFLRIQSDIRSEIGFLPLRNVEAVEDEYDHFSVSE